MKKIILVIFIAFYALHNNAQVRIGKIQYGLSGSIHNLHDFDFKNSPLEYALLLGRNYVDVHADYFSVDYNYVGCNSCSKEISYNGEAYRIPYFGFGLNIENFNTISKGKNKIIINSTSYLAEENKSAVNNYGKYIVSEYKYSIVISKSNNDETLDKVILNVICKKYKVEKSSYESNKDKLEKAVKKQKPFFNKTYSYDGTIRNGLFHGYGKLSSTFVGDINFIYEGEFKNGAIEGKGKIYSSSKSAAVSSNPVFMPDKIVSGTFSNGIPHDICIKPVVGKQSEECIINPFLFVVSNSVALKERFHLFFHNSEILEDNKPKVLLQKNWIPKTFNFDTRTSFGAINSDGSKIIYPNGLLLNLMNNRLEKIYSYPAKYNSVDDKAFQNFIWQSNVVGFDDKDNFWVFHPNSYKGYNKTQGELLLKFNTNQSQYTERLQLEDIYFKAVGDHSSANNNRRDGIKLSEDKNYWSCNFPGNRPEQNPYLISKAGYTTSFVQLNLPNDCKWSDFSQFNFSTTGTALIITQDLSKGYQTKTISTNPWTSVIKRTHYLQTTRIIPQNRLQDVLTNYSNDRTLFYKIWQEGPNSRFIQSKQSIMGFNDGNGYYVEGSGPNNRVDYSSKGIDGSITINWELPIIDHSVSFTTYPKLIQVDIDPTLRHLVGVSYERDPSKINSERFSEAKQATIFKFFYYELTSSNKQLYASKRIDIPHPFTNQRNVAIIRCFKDFFVLFSGQEDYLMLYFYDDLSNAIKINLSNIKCQDNQEITSNNPKTSIHDVIVKGSLIYVITNNFTYIANANKSLTNATVECITPIFEINNVAVKDQNDVKRIIEDAHELVFLDNKKLQEDKWFKLVKSYETFWDIIDPNLKIRNALIQKQDEQVKELISSAFTTSSKPNNIAYNPSNTDVLKVLSLKLDKVNFCNTKCDSYIAVFNKDIVDNSWGLEKNELYVYRWKDDGNCYYLSSANILNTSLIGCSESKAIEWLEKNVKHR